jgi:hypothetical protein
LAEKEFMAFGGRNIVLAWKVALSDPKNLPQNGNPRLVAVPSISKLGKERRWSTKILKAVILAAAGGLSLFSVFAYDKAGDQALATESASRENSLLQLNSLPFSLGQVVDYFDEAFGKRPAKRDDGGFAYVDRENPDEVVIVTVSESEANLCVVLRATGDYGVNYIREFFEAPFFLDTESEQLYALLDGGPGIRSVALERFNVQMRVLEAGRWVLIAVQFRPSNIHRPQLTLLTSRPLGLIDGCRFAEKNAKRPERHLTQKPNQ